MWSFIIIVYYAQINSRVAKYFFTRPNGFVLLVGKGNEHANHKYLVVTLLMLDFSRLIATGLLIHFPRPKCLLSPPSLRNLESTWSTA